MVLLYAWRKRATLADFPSEGSIVRWLASMRKLAMATVRDREQRVEAGRGRLEQVYIFSDLEARASEPKPIDEWFVASKPRERTVPDLGPGGAGWLDQAMAALTPKQRDAVQLCVLDDVTPTEAASYLKVSRCQVVTKRVSKACGRLRRMSERGDLRTAA